MTKAMIIKKKTGVIEKKEYVGFIIDGKAICSQCMNFNSYIELDAKVEKPRDVNEAPDFFPHVCSKCEKPIE